MLDSDFVFPTLSPEQSMRALYAHLFEPALLLDFIGYRDALAWCRSLVEDFLSGQSEGAVAKYKPLEPSVLSKLRTMPALSLFNPPFSLTCLNGVHPVLPWRTPGYERVLISHLSGESWSWTPFGEFVPIAFIAGGPGDRRETAFSVRGPSQAARALAEGWMIRLFRASYDRQLHMSLVPDDQGRRFSRHLLKPPDGLDESLFFETTKAWGREADDFLSFLATYPAI